MLDKKSCPCRQLLFFSDGWGKAESQGFAIVSLVADGFDRVQARRFAGGVPSIEDTDDGAYRKCQYHGIFLDGNRP